MQGVNLANIIKDLTINEKTGQPVLNETIASLKGHLDNSQVLATDELDKLLITLSSELAKSVPHRVHAGKAGTLECLLGLIEAEMNKGDGKSNNAVSCSN